SKWLRRQTHFFQQPSAEILQREDMTAPAADISPEDQGRQDRQGEKDESRVNEPLLQSVHGLRRLDRRNCLAHDAPLNDVRDHEQIEKDQRPSSPPAGL